MYEHGFDWAKNKLHKDFVGFYLFLAAQETFYLWLMKDLRPTYDPNGQKQGKTGNFCKKRVFWGNFYTTYDRTRPQNFGIFTLPRTKIPYRNNREFFGLYQGIINEYQGI